MTAYLSPVDKPRGLALRLVYLFTRHMFSKVVSPVTIFIARMPSGFMSFYSRTSRLDTKLKLPRGTALLIREQVASINTCLFCMDVARWLAFREAADSLARSEALPYYQASPLFSEAERAALDYATELTRDRRVQPATFTRLTRYYNEREICDLVWLVASEHLHNITTLGLNIAVDSLGD